MLVFLRGSIVLVWCLGGTCFLFTVAPAIFSRVFLTILVCVWVVVCVEGFLGEGTFQRSEVRTFGLLYDCIPKSFHYSVSFTLESKLTVKIIHLIPIFKNWRN